MLLIFHLSDIHLRERNAETALSRAAHIARVGREVDAVRTTTVTDVVVIVSGDIAYSGSAEEYAIAHEFLERVRGAVVSEYALTPHIFVTPGNHDCDFGQDTTVRQTLIRAIRPADVDASYVSQCTSVQTHFDQFRARYAGADSPQHLLAATASISLASGHRVTIRTLNTAWMSSIREQPGSLVFPVHLIAGAPHTCDDCHFAITAFHHPYNWLEPTNGREFRAAVDATADLVLTGHEHEGDQYRKVTTSASIDYIEGAAFHPHADDPTSGFNVIALDLARNHQTIARVSWAGVRFQVAQATDALPILRERDRFTRRFKLTEEFRTALADTGVVYAHPHRRNVSLADVFVYPNLIENQLSEKRPSRVIKEQHIENIRSRKAVIVAGPQGSGKSALGKRLSADLYSTGVVTVWLSGIGLKSADPQGIDQWIRDGFVRCYGAGAELWSEFLQLPVERRAVVVDDFQGIGINLSSRDRVCEILLRNYGLCVLLSGDHLGFDELQISSQGLPNLWRFERLTIQDCGYQKREELLVRWCSLSRDLASENELWSKITRFEREIDVVMRNELMPSYPGNVLALASMLEVGQPSAKAGGTSAVLYESLMTQQMQEVLSTGADVDTMYTFLSHFAYRLFIDNTRDVSLRDFVEVHSKYSEQYDTATEAAQTLKDLVRSRLLTEASGRIRFRQPYGFYYFVGRYLSRHLEREDIRKVVSDLTHHLYQDDASNIVLFLCYLTHDDFVLREVVGAAMARFEDASEFDIEAIKNWLVALITDLPDPPELVADQSVADRRIEAQSRRDNSADLAEVRRPLPEPHEDEALARVIYEFNASFKTIELLGQILRNYPGSIEAPKKRSIAEEAYGVALRLLDAWFTLLEQNTEQVVTALADAVRRSQPDRVHDDGELRARVQQWLFRRCTNMVFGVIRHVSWALGADALTPTFAAIAARHAASRRSYALIDLSIKLDLNREFPEKEISQLETALKNNPLGIEVLRQLVVHRLRLFPSTPAQQQFAASKLQIKIVTLQELIESGEKRLPRQGKRKS